MFATRWLTYLAGTGFSPAGIIDLARPHSPLIGDPEFSTAVLSRDAWLYMTGGINVIPEVIPDAQHNLKLLFVGVPMSFTPTVPASI